MLIPLKEYAEKNNVNYATMRKLVSQGRFVPTTNINGKWFVEEDAPFTCNLRNHYSDKSYSRLHNIWRCMKQRCYNVNASGYENYGGRGIMVCDEWLHNSDTFVEWAKENGYKDNLQIDRIDNDGNYEPSNCRWVTPKQNCQNRRKYNSSMKVFVDENNPSKREIKFIEKEREKYKHNLEIGGLKLADLRASKKLWQNGFFDDLMEDYIL